MKLYPVFLTMAFITVLIPGPGVVMTLTNALQYDKQSTFGGILGIAFGAFVVAAISSTGAGLLLATSAHAFTLLKWIGVVYLLYLGWRFWHSPPFYFVAAHPMHNKNSQPINNPAHAPRFGKCFIAALLLQLTNPKAIFFFLSVLPQFINPQQNFIIQFVILVITYSALVVLVHSIYALGAQHAKVYLTSSRGGSVIRWVGTVTYVLFSLVLATTKKA